MNIPNILTILRFLLIPVFAYLMYIEQYTGAAIIFITAGLTDVMDGYIARKYNMITSWGKLADPAADKLMTVTALIMLTVNGKLPVVIIGIVFVKELLMGIGGYLVYRKKKIVVSANWYGKAATVVFYFAIIMIIFDVAYSRVFIGVAVAATLFAFGMYVLEYIKLTRQS